MGEINCAVRNLQDEQVTADSQNLKKYSKNEYCYAFFNIL